MRKVIIYTNENGNVSVCIPTGELPIEQVQIKDIPSNIISHIVDFDSLPNNDNDFFNAWEQKNGVVSINLNKAKELTKIRLRDERKNLLEQQDVLFQRALEQNADTTKIVAEKQRLRDITNLVDQCTTLDDLRALKAEKVD